MDGPRLTATRPDLTPAAGTRQHAERVAEQFEAILVRQMVSSLRQSSTIGEEGGMFGNGTGSGTYADWFDQHFADHLGDSGQLGVKQAILDDLERIGQLAKADAGGEVALARRAADRSHYLAATALRGGIDVTR